QPGAKLLLYYGDLSDGAQLTNLIYNIRPDEIYHLGAQSHVRVSFDMPEYTGDITGLGTARILEALRRSGIKAKFYQASSSEMFGDVRESPQSEETKFHPRSPYGAAKLYAHSMIDIYRKRYGLFVCSAILFNHESPRRGETFVTRKITRGATRIKLGLQEKLYLGNLDAKRDWGFAGDYVEAMWRMLQQETPDDYVVATNELYSVRDFCKKTFSQLGLNYEDHVEIDPRYYRPAEVELLLGDSTKACEQLGWKPETSFDQLVTMMVENDMRLAQQELILKGKQLRGSQAA
ncbi:MAG: GDP-mannose 4,6-dehydratase, partial [Pirellulales bacterium]|nr:GDP-mannose 4,6-dehydratase [Pirellulales bacterium]